MLTMGRKHQGVNSEIRKTLRGSRLVCGQLPPANFGPIVTLPPSLRPKFEGDLRLSHHIHSAFTGSVGSLWDTASTAELARIVVTLRVEVYADLPDPSARQRRTSSRFPTTPPQTNERTQGINPGPLHFVEVPGIEPGSAQT